MQQSVKLNAAGFGLKNNSSSSVSLPHTVNMILDPFVIYHLGQKVNEFRERSRARESFAILERDLHDAFAEVERACLEQLLEDYDINVETYCSGDKTYRRVSRSPKRYMTVAGDITVERSLYRHSRNGETTCPLVLNAGIVEQFWTPQAAKQAIHLVSLLTPAEVETVFEELGHMQPSKSSLDRLPKQLSEKWEAQRETLDAQLCAQLEVPETATMLSVSLDGVLVPTRYTRVLPSDSRYAEASCGTLSFYDKDGEILGTRYFSRMPEHKKKSLKTQLTQALDHVLSKRPSLTVIKVADGARDNWTYLEDTLPQGECVLDFYHASEHLFVAMEAIYGKGNPRIYTEHAKYRHILRHDEHGVDKVLCHLRYQLRKTPSKKALKAEVTYFSRQRHRCHYAQLKAENKPFGSGVVEAACKSIVQLRLKRSGQRWDDDGGQAILTFRSLVKSNLFNQAWELVKEFYQHDLHLPNNVVKFPTK